MSPIAINHIATIFNDLDPHLQVTRHAECNGGIIFSAALPYDAPNCNMQRSKEKLASRVLAGDQATSNVSRIK